MNSLGSLVEIWKAHIQRTYRDWKHFRPEDFAQKIQKGRTRCRYLLCQYQSPIPAHLAMKSRVKNLSLASGYFDHVVIEPGQIFSLFHLLGQPKLQTGFQKGPHFDGEKVVQSFETGLGQLASVYFYLALLAEFEILEHHAALHHPKAWGHDYLPLGLEACVHWAFQDLRFKNHLPFDVALHTQIGAHEIIATLYGQNPHEISANLKQEILEQKPFEVSQLPASKYPQSKGKILRPGVDGFRVRILKQNIQNNQVLDSKTLVERQYAPRTQIEVAKG